MSITKSKGIGSSLESFLQEEGVFEEVRLKALKTALTLQLKDVMKQNNSTLSYFNHSLNVRQSGLCTRS